MRIERWVLSILFLLTTHYSLLIAQSGNEVKNYPQGFSERALKALRAEMSDSATGVADEITITKANDTLKLAIYSTMEDIANTAAVVQSARTNKVPVFFDGGTYLVTSPIPVYSGMTFIGSGQINTVLLQSADSSVFKVHNSSYTSRNVFYDFTVQGDTSYTAPLMDLDSVVIATFDKMWIRRGQVGAQISTKGNYSFLLTFNDVLFTEFDTYALKIGAAGRGISFNGCQFERGLASTYGSSILIDYDYTYPYSYVNFDQCWFEYVRRFIVKSGLVNITNSNITNMPIILGERTQNCSILGNAWANPASPIIDLGYNNKVEAIANNTGHLLSSVGHFKNTLTLKNDTTFVATADGDEYLFKTALNYILADTAINTTIKYYLGDSLLHTYIIDTMSNSPSEGGGSNKRTTTVFTNYFMGRFQSSVDADLEMKVICSAGKGVIAAQKNLITNGTFYDTTYTGWLSTGSPTISASAQAGYYDISAAGAFQLYQDITTIPGHNYMLMAATYDSVTSCLKFGNANTSQENQSSSVAGIARLEDGKYINVAYFRANDDLQRVSFGKNAAETITVKWIALVDLDKESNFTYTATNTGLGSFSYFPPAAQLEVRGVANTDSGVVMISSYDNVITSGDILGRLVFAAPREGSAGYARLPNASIDAVANESFFSGTAGTDLLFKTSSNGNPVERARLRSNGDLNLSGSLEMGTGTIDSFNVTVDSLRFYSSGTNYNVIAGNIDYSDIDKFTFSDNNIGIGTFPSSFQPTQLLEVRGVADTDSGVVVISSYDNVITSGDILGRLMFAAPREGSGSTARLPGAGIWAEASNSYFSGNNDMDLILGTNNAGLPVERMRITDVGKIYATNLGTDTGTQLSITGSDEIVIESSSGRYKENVEDWNPDISTLSKIKPRQFDWKNSKQHGYGFIAEEIADVLPEVALYHDGQINSWDEKKMVAYLIAIIQKQQKEIEELQRKIK